MTNQTITTNKFSEAICYLTQNIMRLRRHSLG